MYDIKFNLTGEMLPKKQEIKKIKDGEICEYLLRFDYEEDVYPSELVLSWELDQIGIVGFWSPKHHFDSNITPDWYKRESISKLTNGAPVVSLYSKENINALTISVSDPKTPIKILTGVIEETGKLANEIRFFAEKMSIMRTYEATVRFDFRKIPFYESVKDASDWWVELGCLPAYQPKDATSPLYSTWYSFHQNTIPNEIIQECKIAKTLGMDTVIVDDGWQTDDNSRGYGYCGDWEVCKNKIPDMKSFVDEIHALGMKFVLWFSVPFVGYFSKCYDKFKGMYLYNRDSSNASVLDPRFYEVRKYLVDTYKRFACEYGIDGFKLDFIDSFRITDESSQEYDKMDTASVEDAVELLLDEICAELRKINPEVLIEFRQSYVGPVICRYGNMLRVTDCPNDPFINRVHSLSMRMTSKGAVHSDMLMWNKDEENEDVAYQLLNTLFCVPQISVRLDRISEGHKRVLTSYLDFWCNHKDTLLNGKIDMLGVDANFTMAKSKLNGDAVGVVYQPVVYKVDKDFRSNIFNASCDSFVYLDLDFPANYTVFDMYGCEISSGKLDCGVAKIEVSKGGRIQIK